MNSVRMNAMIVGVLFIIGTVTGTIAAINSSPILDAPDYLTSIAANESQIIMSTFLVFLEGVACAGIGLALYPIMKKYSTGLAIGVVGFRVAEGIFEILGAVFTIGLLALSQEFVKAGAPDATYFQTIGAIIKAGDSVADQWRLAAIVVYWRFDVLLRLLSIPACPTLALRLGVGWHYLGHHLQRTGHAPCHPRLRDRPDGFHAADIPARDGFCSLADRQRGQFIGRRSQGCKNRDERAS